MSENPVHIPDGLPTLAAGKHYPGDGEACVMEYVSVLAGEDFTDRPKCTNPLIAELARSINDQLANDSRHLLVPLIGRLLTASRADSAINEPLRARLIADAKRYAPNYDADFDSLFFELYAAFGGIGMKASLAAWGKKSSDEAKALVKYLTEILDLYDELAGKPVSPPMSDEALAGARRLIEARLV